MRTGMNMGCKTSVPKRRINKFLFIFGIINMSWAFATWLIPYACWHGYCWDESEYNIPLGFIMFAVGLVMLVASLRKGQRDYGETFICPRCEVALPFSKVPDEQCPHCHIPMEPLKGFYARHPELKKD
ncbi:hypothetical protein GM415_03575 [Pseudodesulfovibrio cashew]|uniref:Uncharacterized protein n=1 Tax=Pseudodesulfovibrio cashew TaxID=2678688 RepID=A0A6I6JDK0_9BACT|nr:hypothetical protein [Pseudodesulfovibrio cashew]QGY39239.1 hypothetical protein GM415_03575 [Pseudodesulfovibrio cashew]